jgi:hypothetical protein
VSQRLDVYDLDGGVCVNCGEKQRRNANSWAWNCHHAVPAQALKRERVPSKYLRGTLVCVLLCFRCHERHTSATARVPYERIPIRVRVAARELGPWAEARLEREHPPAAGRLPA